MLWWWVLDNAPDGNLTGINPEDLAEVAEWKGNPERFIEALKVSGFLDDDLYLHDWDSYAGKLINRRKANTERVRQHRNTLRNADVTVTSPLRNGATVPNPTVPNRITNVIHDDVTLPEWLDKKTFDDFLEMRKKQRAKPTDRAVELIIKDLEAFRKDGDEPTEVLNQSIKNNWKGVFRLKGGQIGRRENDQYRGLPGNKPSGAFADIEG